MDKENNVVGNMTKKQREYYNSMKDKELDEQRTFKNDIEQKLSNLNKIEPYITDKNISTWIDEIRTVLNAAINKDGKGGTFGVSYQAGGNKTNKLEDFIDNGK